MVSIYPYQAAPGLEGVAERACRGEHRDEAHYLENRRVTHYPAKTMRDGRYGGSVMINIRGKSGESGSKEAGDV
jgi:hypothetical protein